VATPGVQEPFSTGRNSAVQSIGSWSGSATFADQRDAAFHTSNTFPSALLSIILMTSARGTITNIRMTILDDDMKTAIRRNKLLGMWAAEQLGLVGESAEAYSNDLAMGTLDPERSDVLGKIRKDFDVAGVPQSDADILRVMNELWLKASGQRPTARGDAVDGAVVQIARKLSS
jgi:hypothetical protein